MEHLYMQVFVHALQKVDMRAVVGQSSSTSQAVAGGTMERQVACYSSHPDELQASPSVLQLSAGGISALQLVFRPLYAGKEWVSRCC
jgi:nephrocystin-4